MGKMFATWEKLFATSQKLFATSIHFSQHDRNIVAAWGRREEKLLMLDVASNRVRNIFATRSQHARNIYSVDFKSNG
jgi:hypothetical protein